MPDRIDHVIAAAHDLAALESTFLRLGFFVTGGGIHPHLGTRNRIILLGEGYLELLAIADASTVSPALQRRLTAGDGWVGFALQSPDLGAEVTDLRFRGVNVTEPAPGRLVAPDGTARRWRVATLGGKDLWAAADPFPFLIQHDSQGEQHQRELAGAGGSGLHANGAKALAEVTIAVADLDAAADRFSQDYDLWATEPQRRDDTLGAEILELPLVSGECVVLARAVGSGPVQRRLATAGEGICRAGIVVANLAATAAYLRQSGVPFAEADGALHVSADESSGALLKLVAE
jgi:hypothetical protein